MKLIKQKSTTILLALSFLVGVIFTFNFALKTEAASQTVGDLTIDYPGSGALFNASNIAPGYEEVKTITVTNNGTINHSFSIALSGAIGDLGNVIQFEPRDFSTNSQIWNHTLAQIAASPDGFIVLPAIAPGQTINFNLAAILPISVGNDYQGKSVTTFGIILGQDASFPYNPTVLPVFGPTGSQDQSSSISSTGGVGRVGQIYSQAGTAGTGAGVTSPPLTPTIEQPTTTGQVAGTTTETMGESTENKIICFWWWALSIIYALFLLIYGWIFYKRERIFDWIWPVLAGALIYIIHIILHRYYTPAKWCHYFIWIELAELLLYFVIYSYYKNRAHKEE